MSGRDEIVLVKGVKLFCETENAILIGDKNIPMKAVSERGKEWVPMVFVQSPYPFENIGDVADVEMPRWVAEQKDFDYEE